MKEKIIKIQKKEIQCETKSGIIIVTNKVSKSLKLKENLWRQRLSIYKRFKCRFVNNKRLQVVQSFINNKI